MKRPYEPPVQEISGQHAEAQSQASDNTLKLREFYNLPGCGIKPIIAERNTTLGKLHAPSQRYLYDIRLLRALQVCRLNSTDSDNEKLTQLVQLKTADVNLSWQKMLLDSDELQVARHANFAHLDKDEEHKSALQSWNSLIAWSPDKLQQKQYGTTSNVTLETLLQAIAKSKTPAKLQNDMQLAIHFLDETSVFLSEHLGELACETNRKEKQRAEYLRNVFNLFFIQQIQPLIGRINGWYYEIATIYQKLGLSDAPDNGLTDDLHDSFITAVKDHVSLWQTFFKRCDLSPNA